MAGNNATNLKNQEDAPFGLCNKLLNNLGSMADILNGCTCPILSSSSIETIGNDYNPEFFNFNQWPTPDNLSRTEYFPDYNTDYNTAVNGVLAYNGDPDNSGMYTMVAAGSTMPRHVNFLPGVYETPASVRFERDGERDAALSCAACKQQLSRYISARLPVPGDVEHRITRGRNDVDDCVINCWYDKKKNSIICSYEPKDPEDTDTDKSTESGSSCSQTKTPRKSVIPNTEQADIDKLQSGNYSSEMAPKLGVNSDLPKTCSLFMGPGHSHPKLMGDVNGKIETIASGKRGDKNKIKNNEPEECSLNTVYTENGSKKVNFQQDLTADSDSKWIAENQANERKEIEANKTYEQYITENKANERKEMEAKEADERYIAENKANERKETEAKKAYERRIAENKANERKEMEVKKAYERCIAQNKANELKEMEAKKADERYIAENKANERREMEARKADRRCIAENEQNERREKEKRRKKDADDKKSRARSKEKRKECDLKAKSVKKDGYKGKEKAVKCAGRVCHSRICGELCALTPRKKTEKEGKHVERKNGTAAKDTEKRDRRCNHSSVKRLQSIPDDTAVEKCPFPKKTSPRNFPTPKVSFKDCNVGPSGSDTVDTDSRKCANAKRSNSSQTSHHKIKAKKRCEGKARGQIKKSLGKLIKSRENSPDVEPKRSCLCAFVCERSKNECGKRVCCSEIKKKRSKSEVGRRSRSKSDRVREPGGKGHEVINKEDWAGSFQMTFDSERPQLMPVKQCWSKNSREVIEDAIKKLADIEKKSLSGIMTPPRVCSDEDPQFYDAVDSAHMNTSESNTPRGDLTRDPSLDQKSPENEPSSS